LRTRLFSTTPIIKGDPLNTTVLAFSTPYTLSLFSNPFGGTFILLMGMAVCLFCLTQSLPEFVEQNPEYAAVIQRIDTLLLLYERFTFYENYGIDLLHANIGNFTPEILRSLYTPLQELVTTRESVFNILNDTINIPEVRFLEGITADRIDSVIEELRSSGNNLMNLIRNIEIRLNIPEQERIPPF
jgi:hypothetical protein